MRPLNFNKNLLVTWDASYLYVISHRLKFFFKYEKKCFVDMIHPGVAIIQVWSMTTFPTQTTISIIIIELLFCIFFLSNLFFLFNLHYIINYKRFSTGLKKNIINWNCGGFNYCWQLVTVIRLILLLLLL